MNHPSPPDPGPTTRPPRHPKNPEPLLNRNKLKRPADIPVGGPFFLRTLDSAMRWKRGIMWPESKPADS